MNEEAGAKLLAAVEGLMAEVVGLRQDMSRDRRATEELATLRKAASERKAKSRESLKSRDCPATESRDGHGTPQVVKAVAFAVQDQDQKQETKILQRPATVTGQNGHATPEPPTRPVWQAYSTAYRLRYGVLPIRNRKVNGQLAQFVARVPADSAPDIAAFYVRHNEQFYVRDRHGVGLLLKDAEKLHTDWKSGRPMTSTEARHADRTQANAAGWAALLKEKPNAVG